MDMDIKKISIDNENNSRYTKHMKKNSSMLIIIVIIILGLLLGGAAYFFKFFPFNGSIGNLLSNSGSQPNQGESGYVAVFLTSNQVYFGKIDNLNSNYPSLKNVYYLKVQQALVQQQDTGTTGVKVEDKNKKPVVTPPLTQDQLTLVKLGNEIHGPTDEIKINKDQILYIENLKSDSKVVKAIQQYEATKNK